MLLGMQDFDSVQIQ